MYDFRIAKATSLHQQQWSTKWTLLARRPFTKSHYYFNSNGTNTKQSQGKQGKLHRIRRKWRWGAGAAGWTVLSFLDWWLLIVGGYLSWQSIFLRWTPLGVVIVAAAQWHLHNREQHRLGLPRTAPGWQVNDSCSCQFWHLFMLNETLFFAILTDNVLLLPTVEDYEPKLGMAGRSTVTWNS